MGSVDIIIGKVIGVHIAEDVLTDGKLDITKTLPIARCGYYEYAVIKETFEMAIPGNNELTASGLEGSRKRVQTETARQIQRSQSTAGLGEDS